MFGNQLNKGMWAILLSAILISGCEEVVDPETELDVLRAEVQASGAYPPLPPPDSFRLKGSTETELRLSWFWPDTADAVRVFRYVGPHDGPPLQICEPRCPYPYSVAWQNIGTVERGEEEEGSFSDADLNPPIEEASDVGLDGLYHYFIEAVVYDDSTGQMVRTSRTPGLPMPRTHTRGLNAPSDVFLAANRDTIIRMGALQRPL